MKIKSFIIAIVLSLAMLLTTSVAFALQQNPSEGNSSVIKPQKVSHVTGKDKRVELKDVNELMPHISFNLPEFIPQHTVLKDTFYSEIPSSVKNLTTTEINKQKEIKFLYNSKEKGKWFKHIVKEAKVILGDKEKTEIMINDKKAEIVEFPDRNVVVVTWRVNEVSHIIESVGFNKETIIKVAESVK